MQSPSSPSNHSDIDTVRYVVPHWCASSVCFFSGHRDTGLFIISEPWRQILLDTAGAIRQYLYQYLPGVQQLPHYQLSAVHSPSDVSAYFTMLLAGATCLGLGSVVLVPHTTSHRSVNTASNNAIQTLQWRIVRMWSDDVTIDTVPVSEIKQDQDCLQCSHHATQEEHSEASW